MATAKVTNLAVARQRLQLDSLEDELAEVQQKALSGHRYLWDVFASAYVWYQKAINAKTQDGSSYLEETYLAQTPPIRSKKGVSEFNKLAKLAFNMNEPCFASTVSRYATAFDYIDRMMRNPKGVRAIRNTEAEPIAKASWRFSTR